MSIGLIAELTPSDIQTLDPYLFMAVIGKRVIHPGGRTSTDELIRQADLQDGHSVLDVGCGVGTTAIEIARRFDVQIKAVDIASIMLERAQANVRQTGLDQQIEVKQGDILSLQFPDDAFDRVIAEAVTMFVDRPRAARELVRVCKPGGRVLATEFVWRRPPSAETRQIFLGEICPGLRFDSAEEWIQIYETAGLRDIQVITGSFDMMTPTGFLRDEGLTNTFRVMIRTLSRRCYVQKMAWLMPRMTRAVPYLGYVLIVGTKPRG
jgi:ubiquinone/menaquinone biosynthesis C-methylase UbiE